MPRNIAASRGSSEKMEIVDLSFGGRYLSTTRKIALEDGKECLTDSPPMQTLTPGRSKKSCAYGFQTPRSRLVSARGLVRLSWRAQGDRGRRATRTRPEIGQ